MMKIHLVNIPMIFHCSYIDTLKFFGDDALRGNTRSHPEHVG